MRKLGCMVAVEVHLTAEAAAEKGRLEAAAPSAQAGFCRDESDERYECGEF